MSESRLKVVVAKNIMPPYRMPFLREMAKQVDLVVFLDAEMSAQRGWNLDLKDAGFRCEVLGSPSVDFDFKGAEGKFGGEKRVRRFPVGLFRALQREVPDCVVTTEFGARSIVASLWCRLRGRPHVIWWEGWHHTEAGVSGIRMRIRRWLVKHAARFWSNGVESHAYLRGLGAADDAIDDGMTGVNTEYFVKHAKEEWSCRNERRRQVNVRGKAVIFSGALAERKGIKEMLAGFDALYANGFKEEVTLLLAGEGVDRKLVESWKPKSEKLHVKLLGFLQLEDLPKFYVTGDLFVLPTLEDNWALATLEPLLCGIPSLVSKYNGAASDLEGEGVVVFDPKNPSDFARALREGLETGKLHVSLDRIMSLARYYHPRQVGARGAASVHRAVASC